jgi:hypothetical protein
MSLSAEFLDLALVGEKGRGRGFWGTGGYGLPQPATKASFTPDSSMSSSNHSSPRYQVGKFFLVSSLSSFYCHFCAMTLSSAMGVGEDFLVLDIMI